jgi:hypothetical protein
MGKAIGNGVSRTGVWKVLENGKRKGRGNVIGNGVSDRDWSQT